MKNKKWGTVSFDDKPMYVVLLVSRNKDNKQFENFKERRISFITTDEVDSEHLKRKFDHFVEDGQPGEMCRMYYSINKRDPQTVYKNLLHFLIDEPDFNLCAMQSKLAGIAADKDCAADKRWMFDFDYDDEKLAKEFCDDIKVISDKEVEAYIQKKINYAAKKHQTLTREYIDTSEIEIKTEIHKTPHGYAIITNRGFDYRTLVGPGTKWPDVDIKRDDLLCVAWRQSV